MVDIAEFDAASKSFSVKFKIKGHFYPFQALADDDIYSLRNTLSKCIYHNLLDLSAFPENLSQTSETEVREELVRRIKESDCDCQRVHVGFLLEKYIPSATRSHDGKRVSVKIKYRDGPLRLDTKLYFRCMDLGAR